MQSTLFTGVYNVLVWYMWPLLYGCLKICTLDNRHGNVDVYVEFLLIITLFLKHKVPGVVDVPKLLTAVHDTDERLCLYPKFTKLC